MVLIFAGQRWLAYMESQIGEDNWHAYDRMWSTAAKQIFCPKGHSACKYTMLHAEVQSSVKIHQDVAVRVSICTRPSFNKPSRG